MMADVSNNEQTYVEWIANIIQFIAVNIVKVQLNYVNLVLFHNMCASDSIL